MPSKETPPGSDPPWQVILEELRSQHRAVLRVVEARFDALQSDVNQLREENRVRFDTLEAVVRQNSADIRQNSADIRVLTERVDKLDARVEQLASLDERVQALDRHQA